MEDKLKLPVGIENFAEIRESGFYYVDKTRLIEQLLQNWSKVNLFTRPRRFGKTLNMSMLRSFLEIGAKESLFEGLYISGNRQLCREYLGKYPVIFLSLKAVDGLNFGEALTRTKTTIQNEARRHYYLQSSRKLNAYDIRQYDQLLEGNPVDITDSLRMLSELLYKHYDQKVVIIIDEYDVPLDKAFQNDYYDEMVSLIRGIFGQALKTNDFLQFAVLTGCLRISKESVFTGLNNFRVFSVLEDRFDEQFGFSDAEVQDLLAYYDLSEHFAEIKEWYDGYHFGNTDVYCPWDVMNYVDQLRSNPNAEPQDFWSNSSGNAIVRRFIDKANVQTRDEIERLIDGEAIAKEVDQELTYKDIDDKIDNLWSVLFTTGYLTQQGKATDGYYLVSIPNKEIHNLFVKKIREWFSEVSRKDGKTMEEFCTAFLKGNPAKIEDLLGNYLWNTISIRDTSTAKDKKENFYHGILLGLLGYKDTWLIKSNAESGIGYSDILIEVPDGRIGIVIEIKYAENGDMTAACIKAMQQIENKNYIATLQQDGMKHFIMYGIACYKKDCKVVMGE